MSLVSPMTNSTIDQHEADDAGPLHDAERDRPPAHLLGQRPEDVPAVERQEREQVDDRQRQRDHRQDAAAPDDVVELRSDWRVVS